MQNDREWQRLATDLIGRPELGQQTGAVLAELGYEPWEISELRAEGVVG